MASKYGHFIILQMSISIMQRFTPGKKIIKQKSIREKYSKDFVYSYFKSGRNFTADNFFIELFPSKLNLR